MFNLYFYESKLDEDNEGGDTMDGDDDDEDDDED